MATRTVPCPTCGRQVEWSPESQWRPFCSERCKLIDLGAWFTEQRTIPGDPVEGQPPDPDQPDEPDRRH